jgi:hypothetical protein
VRLRRSRFGDTIARQLDVFATDQAALVAECREKERAYARTERDEAEEAYGDYMDVVEAATEALAGMRERFARTLGEDVVEQYEDEFNRAVRKRWPPFGIEIENR